MSVRMSESAERHVSLHRIDFANFIFFTVQRIFCVLCTRYRGKYMNETSHPDSVHTPVNSSGSGRVRLPALRPHMDSEAGAYYASPCLPGMSLHTVEYTTHQHAGARPTRDTESDTNSQATGRSQASCLRDTDRQPYPATAASPVEAASPDQPAPSGTVWGAPERRQPVDSRHERHDRGQVHHTAGAGAESRAGRVELCHRLGLCSGGWVTGVVLETGQIRLQCECGVVEYR